jgi:prepilin-type N-terminal cleavage/methylation domain-containing protein
MIRSAKSGFTLIELAIVLCIIAILVAMAALNFSNNVAKAEYGALRSLTSQVRTACAMQLSEVMDPALVEPDDFVILSSGVATAATLVQLPANCGATAPTATTVTCTMTKKQVVVTYDPITAAVSAVYTDVV